MKMFLTRFPKLYYVLVFISCCLIQGSTIGLLSNCLGLFIVPISNNLNITVGKSALFVTIVSLSSGLMSPLVNKIISRFKLYLIAIISNLLVLIAYIGIGYSKNIYLIYLFAIILGSSLVLYSTLVSSIIINNWFDKYNGVLTGACMAFSGIAGALFNPIINNLIINNGYKYALVVSGILNIIF